MTRVTRPDRLDRLVLATIGVVLAAAGAYGLARGGGLLGGRRADDPVLGSGLRRFVADHALAFWAAVAVLGLVLGWLGWRWLRAQFPASKAVTALDLDGDGDEAGSTVLSSGAVTAALSEHVSSYDHVRWARARVLAGRPRPQVELRVGVSDDVDVGHFADFVEARVLADLRQALEVDEVDAHVELRLTGPPARTVR